MKRRNFLLAPMVLVTAPTWANNVQSDEDIQPTTIVHVVNFWLKEDLSEKEKKNFVGFFEELRKIDVIKTLNYGIPAHTNPRPVVDNSFDYTLIVTFKNLQDITRYETHPIHLKAIEKYQHHWTKVMVKDTSIIK
ncbi:MULTISPECIES: Dabb family protein [Sphingobacterium]|jgi:Stress responsive A/B Barrel Domain|uniref:Dabb family protein n=1 Tax=Sphingobacterium TaxID=28453 RepID=UPI00062803D5|nr:MULTISPECIES: Dabb family protein [Sphingobacterium]KKO91828.1 stress protein [Sphingobacterium sp. Ag1]